MKKRPKRSRKVSPKKAKEREKKGKDNSMAKTDEEAEAEGRTALMADPTRAAGIITQKSVPGQAKVTRRESTQFTPYATPQKYPSQTDTRNSA